MPHWNKNPARAQPSSAKPVRAINGCAARSESCCAIRRGRELYHFLPPVTSRDGKLFAYGAFNEQKRHVLNIIPFEGGAIIKTIDLPSTIKGQNYVWAPDGRAMIVIKIIGGAENVWKFPLDGSSPTQLTDFKSGIISYIDLSRDGKQLALSHGEPSADVALISNFR